MRKFMFALVAALVVFGAVSGAYAGIQVGSDPHRGESNTVLTAVYNNSGSTLQSGAVVVWDTTSTLEEYQYGVYVTTTTSADSNLVAGVVVSPSIVNGAVGTICTYGPAFATIAGSTDMGTNAVGTAMGTTTVAGQGGNGTGLGIQMETMANSASGGNASDTKRMLIFVNPSNGE